MDVLRLFHELIAQQIHFQLLLWDYQFAERLQAALKAEVVVLALHFKQFETSHEPCSTSLRNKHNLI